MNPARSFAPALYNWNWKNQWLYWFAAIGGTVSASILYKFVFHKDSSAVQKIERKNGKDRKISEEAEMMS